MKITLVTMIYGRIIPHASIRRVFSVTLIYGEIIVFSGENCSRRQFE